MIMMVYYDLQNGGEDYCGLFRLSSVVVVLTVHGPPRDDDDCVERVVEDE